jgi:hypothetical protein
MTSLELVLLTLFGSTVIGSVLFCLRYYRTLK